MHALILWVGFDLIGISATESVCCWKLWNPGSQSHLAEVMWLFEGGPLLVIIGTKLMRAVCGATKETLYTPIKLMPYFAEGLWIHIMTSWGISCNWKADGPSKQPRFTLQRRLTSFSPSAVSSNIFWVCSGGLAGETPCLCWFSHLFEHSPVFTCATY